MQWQYAFDRGDFRWLDPAYRISVVPQRALLAIRMFEQFGSYAAAARGAIKSFGCLSLCQKYGKVRHPIVAKEAQLCLHED